MRLRVLVADDSIVFRRVIADVLASLPEVEVVGSVPNGKLAVQRVQELRPDLLTLDMEMPEMDGLAVLDALKQSKQETSVIVVSALTRKGGELTMRALEKGAFDFLSKPETSSAVESRALIMRELAPRLRALGHRLEVRKILRNPTSPAPASSHLSRNSAASTPVGGTLNRISARMDRLAASVKAEIVVIGVSTGGPSALARLLPAIPGNIGVPILIVQHMPPVFTQSLAESLSAKCAIRVREAADGEGIEPNTAYIAPGGRQMRVQAAVDGRKMIRITDDPPENNCRPAVDYLFRSAASCFSNRVLAVILTGMGSDGTLGLRVLKEKGCFAIAQDEASCTVYGMPRAAVEANLADVVLPLDEIAARITDTIRGRIS